MPADLSWPFSHGQLGLFSRNPCVFIVLLCFERWQVLWEVEANPGLTVGAGAGQLAGGLVSAPVDLLP